MVCCLRGRASDVTRNNFGTPMPFSNPAPLTPHQSSQSRTNASIFKRKIKIKKLWQLQLILSFASQLALREFYLFMLFDVIGDHYVDWYATLSPLLWDACRQFEWSPILFDSVLVHWLHPLVLPCAADSLYVSTLSPPDSVVRLLLLSSSSSSLLLLLLWTEKRRRNSDLIQAGRSGDRIPVGARLFHRPWGRPNPLYSRYQVSLPGGEAAGTWFWTPPLLRAMGLKRVWRYISVLPLGFHVLLKD